VPFFMEGVAGVPEMNLEDGLHPTAKGHERLAANVEPALREAIASVKRAPPQP
jgi:acyl-CoA thioesterase-1